MRRASTDAADRGTAWRNALRHPVATGYDHRARWTGVVCSIMLAGCAGHATIDMTPLDIRKISLTEPLVVRAAPDECYFWINEKQELAIAMRTVDRSILGKSHEREFILSLVMDGLPAGSARQYRVGLQEMRARSRAGYSHTRSASLVGVLAVWDYGADRLRGRFRIIAKQQTYSVLTNWRGDRRVLFVGEFTARADQAAGERILARTEEDGMFRTQSGSTPVPVQGPPREAHQNTN